MTSHKAREATLKLFADIHYLLISLKGIDSLLISLEKLFAGYPEIEYVRNKHRKCLADYDTFRNHLEHISERVKDGYTDLGTVIEDKFTFNNDEFEIGVNREKEVETLCGDIRTALFSIVQKQTRMSIELG